MKTREDILNARVDTNRAEYDCLKVSGVVFENEYSIHLYNGYPLDTTDICIILFGKSNFWEVMYDEDLFIDYLPAAQVCNELDIYAPLGYQACCVVAKDRLQFLNEILK